VASPEMAAGRVPALTVRALYTETMSGPGAQTAETPTTVYLAFGSNLGDRAATIARSIDLLAASGVAPRARSPLYETDPVTPDPQPDYLNAVLRAETALSPRALMALCLEVEQALGRRRPAGRALAPREIDVDLLLYGAEVIADPPSLIVPHPRLLERPFVRIPLSDVAAPGLRHPVTGEPLDRAAPDRAVRLA
jgi:2-amino-4-hydroxy-6-hydroxymethyldihydropteridine diphosphokinase